MTAVFFFLALILPVLLVWLAFGPKLLLVKAIWVMTGILLFACGGMIANDGGGNILIGLFFAIAGVTVVVVAIKSYFATHLQRARERRSNHEKSRAMKALDNLE